VVKDRTGKVTHAARTFAANLGDEGRRARFLIRDRDTKFTASFDRIVGSVGAGTILAPVRLPKADSAQVENDDWFWTYMRRFSI
jgi:hypothetical protein